MEDRWTGQGNPSPLLCLRSPKGRRGERIVGQEGQSTQLQLTRMSFVSSALGHKASNIVVLSAVRWSGSNSVIILTISAPQRQREKRQRE
jgi:hypothetical protein